MLTKHGVYEFNKEQLAKAGDHEQWLFRVRNTETGNAFTYKVAISGSALASEGLPEDIQLTVKSQGDHLVKSWLDKNIEAQVQAMVTTQNIKSKTLSTEEDWIEWKDF